MTDFTLEELSYLKDALEGVCDGEFSCRGCWFANPDDSDCWIVWLREKISKMIENTT